MVNTFEEFVQEMYANYRKDLENSDPSAYGENVSKFIDEHLNNYRVSGVFRRYDDFEVDGFYIIFASENDDEAFGYEDGLLFDNGVGDYFTFHRISDDDEALNKMIEWYLRRELKLV